MTGRYTFLKLQENTKYFLTLTEKISFYPQFKRVVGTPNLCFPVPQDFNTYLCETEGLSVPSGVEDFLGIPGTAVSTGLPTCLISSSGCLGVDELILLVFKRSPGVYLVCFSDFTNSWKNTSIHDIEQM